MISTLVTNRTSFKTTYEAQIPYATKRIRGQYDTPSPVVELVTRLAVKDHLSKVLDPACGTGNFLLKSLEVMSELQAKYGKPSMTMRNQVYGVEIDPISAELARNSLGSKILTADFMRINPRTRSDARDDNPESWLPTDFDVVLSNPPFTEYREIRRRIPSNKACISKHLDGRSGLYGHFLIHASQFLKETGTLVFVLPNGWMESRWGVKLQKFILNNFAICLLISFDKDIFAKAMVDACVIVLTKLTGQRNYATRNTSRTKFLHLKTTLHIKDILRILSINKNVDEQRFRLFHLNQLDLHHEKPWTTYIRQTFYCDLLAGKSKITPLSEIAQLRYSMKEGGYNFFILSKNILERWNIESKFLVPIVSSPSKIGFLDIQRQEVDERLLRVSEPRNRLIGTNALRYIEYWEQQKIKIKKGRLRGKSVLGYCSLPTFRGKQQWYTVKTAAPSAILVPAFIRNKFVAVWNRPHVEATANFYGLEPLEKDHTFPLLAYLNSTLASCLIEEIGKSSMGRGLLDIRAYGLRNMPTLDPNKQSHAENQELSEQFAWLCSATRHSDQSEMECAKKNLDEQVFKRLGLSKNRKTILRALAKTKQLRLGRIEPEVLIKPSEHLGKPNILRSSA